MYNTHLQVLSPFHRKPIGQLDPSFNFVKTKSEEFDRKKLLMQQQKAMGLDVPLPNVIMRHMAHPLPYLKEEMPNLKVVGFRIEIKGRMGTRSRRRTMFYGRMDLKDIHPLSGTFVDYGKSHYVTKFGSTGVRVWVTYGSK